MFSSAVTCSKKTPSDSDAGVAAMRVSRPPSKRLIVADSPSPTPSMVSTPQRGQPLPNAAVAACASW